MVIKSYTDIEQSKKLAKILPLESADMFYPTNSDWEGKIIGLLDVPLYIGSDGFVDTEMGEIHAWSLAALLKVIPSTIIHDGNIVFLEFHVWDNSLEYINNADYILYVTESYVNPVDACYEMILKLHELNVL